MSYKEIWTKLSKIDCNQHVQKKGNLSYLSWAWAWGTLMEHYPDATFSVAPESALENGTVECTVAVKIGNCERSIWLPVMDNRNKAIPNPTTRDISDTRMRCLVKVLALYGLGFYLYAGEDINSAAEPDTISPEMAAELKLALEETESDVARFCQAFKIESVDALPKNQFARAIGMLNKKRQAA